MTSVIHRQNSSSLKKMPSFEETFLLISSLVAPESRCSWRICKLWQLTQTATYLRAVKVPKKTHTLPSGGSSTSAFLIPHKCTDPVYRCAIIRKSSVKKKKRLSSIWKSTEGELNPLSGNRKCLTSTVADYHLATGRM